MNLLPSATPPGSRPNLFYRVEVRDVSIHILQNDWIPCHVLASQLMYSHDTILALAGYPVRTYYVLNIGRKLVWANHEMCRRDLSRPVLLETDSGILHCTDIPACIGLEFRPSVNLAAVVFCNFPADVFVQRNDVLFPIAAACRRCAHCDMAFIDHADDGTCLYEASVYEEKLDVFGKKEEARHA